MSYSPAGILLSCDIKCHVQVACITRLVPQKGVHLIKHAIYRTLELGGQFVLLGSSPVPEIQVSSGFLISNVILGSWCLSLH